MIIKAYIVSVPKPNENNFTIRVPYFEDNTGSEMVFDNALLCHQPGEYNLYDIGDCVWVSFEGNTQNYPLILGKLYTKIEKETNVYHDINQLRVTGTAILPDNTTIAGYGAEQFYQMSQKISSLSGSGSLKYTDIVEW